MASSSSEEPTSPGASGAHAKTAARIMATNRFKTTRPFRSE